MAYRLLAGAAASALLLAGAANADDWGRGHYRGGWNDWDRGHHGYRHHDDDDDGEDAALLIGGALLGLVVGSAIADSGDSHSSYSYGSYGGYSSPSYGPSYGYGYDSYGYSPPSYGSYAPPPYTPAPTYSYATPTYVAGGSIGNSTAKCAESGGYYQTGGLVGGPLGAPAPAYPSYPSEPEYYPYEDDLYGGPGYQSSGPAAEECERVMQVTKLPDGREIHEPVTVCRQAYYGDWNVER
jgi:hypothetical protein